MRLKNSLLKNKIRKLLWELLVYIYPGHLRLFKTPMYVYPVTPIHIPLQLLFIPIPSI